MSQALFAAAFGALAPLVTRGDRPVRSALALAGLWTAIDWIRGMWPIGGFTWGGLGYTQHGNGLTLPLATVTGVWGVTFVVLLVNALLLEALVLRRPGRAAGLGPAIPVVIALGVALLPAAIPVRGASGPPMDVAVVQGNVPRALASDRLLQSDQVALNHIDLNRTLASDPPDLAVWPENALADDPARDATLGAAVSASIRAVGAPTIVGAITPGPGDTLFNVALLYDARGSIVDSYAKIHLVPFGEYIPWHSVLGWTQRYRHGLGTFSSGSRVHAFDVNGTLVGTPICFENTFPGLFRQFVADGARLMVVTTNDSSYLDSPASREHVIMSQLRAVETGRWVVQAAVSGESAIVNAHGQVVRRTGLFAAGGSPRGRADRDRADAVRAVRGLVPVPVRNDHARAPRHRHRRPGPGPSSAACRAPGTRLPPIPRRGRGWRRTPPSPAARSPASWSSSRRTTSGPPSRPRSAAPSRPGRRSTP